MDSRKQIIKESDVLQPFYFVESTHPFYPQIQLFQKTLNASPLYLAVKKRALGNTKFTVHSEIKGRLLPDQTWELNRFYWSFQYWDASLPAGFSTITLYFSVKTGETRFYEFPEDPYLIGMTDYFNNMQSDPVQVKVLRYVPVRRFTFHLSHFNGQSEPVIAKFKRRSRFREGFDLLKKIADGSKGQALPFALPAPIALDAAHRLYFQETKKGEDLTTLLSTNNCHPLLYQVGQLHADLHTMKIEDLPVFDLNACLEEIETEIAWIAFFFPGQAVFLKSLLQLLLKNCPEIPRTQFVFCHGDFVCSQLLKDGDDWAVIDFDLAKMADPCFEIAMFIASLRYDVPLIEKTVVAHDGFIPPILNAVTEAYLSGYEDKAKRPVNRERLLWYRIRFEIYYLALMIKKDRFHPNAFQYGVGLLEQLQVDLTKDKK